MSKQGTASRWNGGRARFTEEMVEDDRQVRDKHNRFRRLQDDTAENTWIERRKERPGFRKGARIWPKL